MVMSTPLCCLSNIVMDSSSFSFGALVCTDTMIQSLLHVLGHPLYLFFRVPGLNMLNMDPNKHFI